MEASSAEGLLVDRGDMAADPEAVLLFPPLL
jgi:hypothetical protein